MAAFLSSSPPRVYPRHGASPHPPRRSPVHILTHNTPRTQGPTRPLTYHLHTPSNHDQHPSYTHPAPSPRRMSRRVALAVAAATLAAGVLNTPQPVTAVTLAPVPMNAYGRRRRRKAYEKFLADRINPGSVPITPSSTAPATAIATNSAITAIPFAASAAAAVLASAFSTLVAHPIDTIKTRIQAGQVPVVLSDRFLGLSTLYRGLFSNILKEAPNAGIYLGVYELVKSAMFQAFPALHDVPLLVFMLAGAIGDAVGSVVRVPAEIVNKRLQLGLSTNAAAALKDAFFSQRGLQHTRNIWAAILLRDMPYGALQIGIYEQATLLLRHNIPDETAAPGIAAVLHGISSDVAIGAIAGLIAAFLTTPSDVLVTRLNQQAAAPAASDHPESSSPGVIATYRSIVVEEGPRALWKGSVQRGIYYMPLVGIFFAIYELAKHLVVHPDQAIALLDSIDWLPIKFDSHGIVSLHLPHGLAGFGHRVADWGTSFVSISG